MRLLGTKTEKSHSLYLIIYQVFKSIFSIENETLRLFLKKTFSRKKESFFPYRATGLHPSLPRALPWARSFWAFSPYLNHMRKFCLDSIKEGADEPVANDTCDVTYESYPGDMLHIPAEGNLLQAHYYHTSSTTDNQH